MNKSQEMLRLVSILVRMERIIGNDLNKDNQKMLDKAKETRKEVQQDLKDIADSIPEWISVEDRLPEEKGHYDFYNVNSYNFEDGGFYVPGHKDADIELKIRWTHWRKCFYPESPDSHE